MNDDYPLDSVSKTALEWMRVKNVDELVALPTAQLIRRLTVAPFPPSEKFLGIVLLSAVESFATQRTTSLIPLARSSQRPTCKSRSLG